jgi:hypothetical protein
MALPQWRVLGRLKNNGDKCWDNTVDWAKIATIQTPRNAPLVIDFSDALTKQGFDIRFSHSYWLTCSAVGGQKPGCVLVGQLIPMQQGPLCQNRVHGAEGSPSSRRTPCQVTPKRLGYSRPAHKPHTSNVISLLCSIRYGNEGASLSVSDVDRSNILPVFIRRWEIQTYIHRTSCRKVSCTWYDVTWFVEHITFKYR